MPKKVLIVDDDAELAEELTEILQGYGYSSDKASDSVQAEALIKQNCYDVYLFDYKMAGLSGIDLLRKVKEIHCTGPVIIMSGRPFIEKILKDEKVDTLVSAVIKKPFDIELLLQKLQEFSPE
jgi:DNA-binding response OmpR family regulator